MEESNTDVTKRLSKSFCGPKFESININLRYFIFKYMCIFLSFVHRKGLEMMNNLTTQFVVLKYYFSLKKRWGLCGEMAAGNVQDEPGSFCHGR